MPEQDIKEFQQTVWDFYKKNKRDFPWRNTVDPYHILVSEIMLQQTQAPRVVKFYEKWIKQFPDFGALSKATFSEIYPFWQGLGYNRRALALQKTAQKAVADFKGELPKDILALEQFPGIGPYTARAVSIFSYNTPVACIETNIRRVFIHHFFADKDNIEDKEILKLAELALDKKNSREWHWALMDYGAHLRSAHQGKLINPNRRAKNYAVQSKFEGSLRQIRGAILRMLSGKTMTSKELEMRIEKLTTQDKSRTQKVILALQKEGLILYNSNKKVYSLN